LSRGSGPASYPTKPLGSYHVSPTTTWMDPPSTSDVRRWGALLTSGWAEIFGSPDDSAGHPLVNITAINQRVERVSFGCPNNSGNATRLLTSWDISRRSRRLWILNAVS
jgi:hypothetical protein